ncbi:hypothetical protein CC1G_08763 [Coprinopsis cinerea okayama7|uniref:Uncharacterized protein n=1 Tax=Coprinopsis cinerea (strain Okayama-7 / 130 / ATCC MYA-4618 / FGSC 9003) TaxID=240176 RepID=A8NJ26_COPC7|nr:hypothetical protein CC1G_08763 [Coprinopsis cinerea okayama7\|eukprot:XP_001834132.1 hypothetical protein CC1G_08763 [Coprinopsis cinerea okayama7\
MPSIRNTDDKFKKPQQIVGRPEVTDHDINESYMRNPPHNLELSAAARKPGPPQKATEQAAKDRRPAIVNEDQEVLGINEATGREKKAEDLAEVVQHDSLNPNDSLF